MPLVAVALSHLLSVYSVVGEPFVWEVLLPGPPDATLRVLSRCVVPLLLGGYVPCTRLSTCVFSTVPCGRIS